MTYPGAPTWLLNTRRFLPGFLGGAAAATYRIACASHEAGSSKGECPVVPHPDSTPASSKRVWRRDEVMA